MQQGNNYNAAVSSDNRQCFATDSASGIGYAWNGYPASGSSGQNTAMTQTDSAYNTSDISYGELVTWCHEQCTEPDLSPGVGIACLLRQTLESSFSTVSKPNFASKK